MHNVIDLKNCKLVIFAYELQEKTKYIYIAFSGKKLVKCIVSYFTFKYKMIGSENFQSKTLKPDSGDSFGIQSSLKTGLKVDHSSIQRSHPLAELEKSYDLQMKQRGLASLRNSQGIHAPLKIQMEINAVGKAMTRLPCLPSSNFARDILNGTDELILPEDVFGLKEDSEVMGDPHLMMEHKLGLKSL